LLVLDTDHLSALGGVSEAALPLLERIHASGEAAATTIVTVEEQLRCAAGWPKSIASAILTANRRL